jgi:hypothetical protein
VREMEMEMGMEMEMNMGKVLFHVILEVVLLLLCVSSLAYLLPCLPNFFGI